MITYLVHSSILLSGFTLFYWFLLRNETFFKLNRWTIIAGIFLCLSLPMVQIPSSISMWRTADAPISSIIEKVGQSQPAQVALQELPDDKYKAKKQPTKSNTTTTYGQASTTPSIGKILSTLYLVGVVIFFLVFLMQLIILLNKRMKLNTYKTGKYTIVEMTKDEEPYSFLNSIFINPASYDPDTYEHIIEHEKIHIDQSHFIDKILAEILVIVFWFNPITWLLRSSVSKNLEFLTDYSLIQKGIEVNKYQMSLLKVSVSNKPFNLTMSYNNSFLKNRIIMMNSKKSSIVSSWKYLFILPLFTISMLSLNAISGDQIKQANTQINIPPVTIPVASELKKENNIDLKEFEESSNSAVVKRELDLDEITSLGLAIATNVTIAQGNKQVVRVEGPEDMIDYLSKKVENGNWNIEFKNKKNHKSSRALKIYVQVKHLDALAISGSGRIVGENKFKNLNHLNLAISGSGDIELDADTKSMNNAISGSGNISLSGDTGEIRVAISGSGNIRAKELQATRLNVAISGSGNTWMAVSDHIKAAISGNGSIYYSGNPKIEVDKEQRHNLIKS